MPGQLPEGVKYDEGKPRYDLLSPLFLEGVSRVLGFGAEKYEPYNWAEGLLWSRVYRAGLGHMLDWWKGEENDKETGMPHLWHAGCCLMFLSHYIAGGYQEYDDRPNVKENPTATHQGNSEDQFSWSRGQRGEDSVATVTPYARPDHLSSAVVEIRPFPGGTEIRVSSGEDPSNSIVVPEVHLRVWMHGMLSEVHTGLRSVGVFNLDVQGQRDVLPS